MRLFIEGLLSDLGYEMSVLPFALFRTTETVQSAAEDGRRIGRQDTGSLYGPSGRETSLRQKCHVTLSHGGERF